MRGERQYKVQQYKVQVMLKPGTVDGLWRRQRRAQTGFIAPKSRDENRCLCYCEGSGVRVTTGGVVVWWVARGGGASLGVSFFGFFFSRLRRSLFPMR